MYIRIFLAMALALPMMTATASATSLTAWLTAELEQAFDAAEVPQERRAVVLNEAARLADGYAMADLTACHRESVENHLIPRTTYNAADPSRSIDSARFEFGRHLVLLLHSPGDLPDGSPAVYDQMDALADAFTEGVAVTFPGMLDDDTLAALTEKWRTELHERATGCMGHALYQPIPEGEFNALLDMIRVQPLSERSLARVDRLWRRSLGELTDGEEMTREHIMQTLNHPAAAEFRAEYLASMEQQMRVEPEELTRALDRAARFELSRDHLSHWYSQIDAFAGVDMAALNAALEAANLTDAEWPALHDPSVVAQ